MCSTGCKKILDFLYLMLSYFIALSRLVLWTVLFFFSGLQRTLFLRGEVVCVEFKTIPLKCDREDTGEKLAYLDKLCLENPDLVDFEGEEDSFSDSISIEDETPEDADDEDEDSE